MVKSGKKQEKKQKQQNILQGSCLHKIHLVEMGAVVIGLGIRKRVSSHILLKKLIAA